MTIAQQFIDKNTLYKEYDFIGRKKRRPEAMDKSIASKNLMDLRTVLENNKIQFVLMFGTALGAVRENDFIDYDTDTDTCIFEKDRNKLIHAIPEILALGFELIRTKEPDDLVTFMRNDEYIDIGILRLTQKNLVVYYTYQNHLIARRFLDNPISIEFLNKVFFVPNNTKEYLTKTYGSDWHIPKKDEPAMNTGLFNYYFRLKRLVLRTRLGKYLKKIIKKILGKQ